MFPSRIAAAVLAACLVVPAGAIAKQPRKHRVHHSVKVKRSAVPQPTVVVPHKYTTGGDGGEITTPPGMKVSLFDPVAVATGLGNQALTQLGLPTLPV